MADGVAAGGLGRLGLRLQVEHGVDARHPRLHLEGADPSPPPSRQHPVRPALRVLREFRAAAVARRGGARQTLDPRPHAGRRMAALCEFARLLRLHVRASRQEADVHGLRVRPGHRMEPRPQPAVASARPAEASRRAAAGSRSQQALPRRRRRCISSTATRRASNGSSPTTPTTACSRGCARATTRRRAASSSSISRRRSGATIASACRSPAAGAKCSTPTPPIMAAATRGTPALVSAVVTPESPELHLVLPPLAAVYLVPEV